jgi:Protein of unknown function DUF262/HNH endonuclease
LFTTKARFWRGVAEGFVQHTLFTQQSNKIEIDDDYYASEEDADDGDAIKGKIYTEKKDFPIQYYKTMWEEGELVLQPEYQRKFVIDLKFASRLIESIILDVPIPPVFLAEELDGKYSVIDGQQRLTAFIHFLLGSLPDENKTIFKLTGVKQLTPEQGKGKTFSQIEDRAIKHKIKNASIETIIIKNSSHEDLKFAIFERLNTGSVKLNEDELRNSIYRGAYIKLLDDLDKDPTFHSLIANENWKKRMIYRGIILRFFALSEKSQTYKASMKQFCNKELKDHRHTMIGSERKEYEQRFKKCLDLVKTVFGENAFRRFVVGNSKNVNGKWSSNKINMALFDVQMCGFVPYTKSQIIPKADEIRETMLSLMCDRDFIDCIELKTNDTTVLKKRFEIWTSELKRIVGSSITEPRLFTFEQKYFLYNQANKKCAICGQQILSIEDAEADHVVAYSKGGLTELKNGQITHRFCNRHKSDRANVIAMVSEQEHLVDIFAIYKGKSVSAKFNPKSEVVLYDGIVYVSPSGAGTKAKMDFGAHDKTTTNGWQFWKFKDKSDGSEKFIDALRKTPSV